ncbi:MAG: hypothetical protein ACRDMA_13040 [Solirubrobacterales bacterium]
MPGSRPGAPETVAIPARFNGPPTSANGGFTCGTVAGLLGAATAEVNLRAPPPLDTPLAVVREDATVSLRDGDAVVADGRPIDRVDVTPPGAVAVADARRASRDFPWLGRHPFPSCFVCGPRREHDDGLDIFAGPVDDGLFACAWTPAAEWADDSGRVRPEVVWAALDCPSSVPTVAADRATKPVVLARLAASLEVPIAVEEPHLVASWGLGTDGRKRHAASAILDADGEVLARARTLWIEVPSH